MRFGVGCADRKPTEQAKQEGGEQLYRKGLGFSPWFPRFPTHEQYTAAMSGWSDRIRVMLDDRGGMYAVLDGIVIDSRRVRAA